MPRSLSKLPPRPFAEKLHGYAYARWPYLYIGIGTGEHPLTRIQRPAVRLLGRLLELGAPAGNSGRGTLADGYHGKVVPLEAATRSSSPWQEDVDLGDLEQIIPYPVARDLVLKNPDHIVALECPCRSPREPLPAPGRVPDRRRAVCQLCHGAPPRRSRWISQSEAVDILRAEQERGHVSHAFFKDAMLGRFYAICNCCSCCCGAMKAHRNGTPMIASSGYVAQVDGGCAPAAASAPTCASSRRFRWMTASPASMLPPAWAVACASPTAHRKPSPWCAIRPRGSRWRSRSSSLASRAIAGPSSCIRPGCVLRGRRATAAPVVSAIGVGPTLGSAEGKDGRKAAGPRPLSQLPYDRPKRRNRDSRGSHFA
jgi:hypothetical protein